MHHHTRRRFQLRSFVTPDPAGAFRGSLVPLGVCLFSAALAGCTRSEVSLGAGQEGSGAELVRSCGDGTREGSTIVASTQEQVEALRGCNEVNSDLELLGFPGLDLSPLAELRVVHGDLYVGSRGNITGSPIGTISSLDGLQALEQVNNLSLAHLTVPDLSALARLRSVRLDPLGPHDDGGRLSIYDCNGLRDLSGLDSLTEFDELQIDADAQLESLSGLQVPGQLQVVSLSGVPALEDLSALAPLQDLESLWLQNTAVANLDPLQLISADRVHLSDNDSLERVDSLSSLRTLRELVVSNNDLLQELPGLEYVNGVELVQVVGNAELRSVPSFRRSSGKGGEHVTFYDRPAGLSLSRDQALYGFDLFEVGDNPKLTRISPMGASPTARQVAIYGNAGLTAIDFGTMISMDRLTIVNNASLASVQFSQLGQITSLQILNNPLLSTAALAGVQTLDGVFSGNLDEP